ncbi:putative toxin-antitoxin system toxin component, PIN family [Gloeobacter morelensis]|uniref:Toxin-antitoxin system toxin component, PIN family n=1 Tax=Gloeobacter morelensis MG652769 TaxID=2781736 RepID=A0ABY3PJ57_9CYAN|nr:putative toxin-antitoxin system toxin component, PIN family [Gloeobacter morelensis]UFP93692.1 putative toxin-antitoxin system toxin component, PIN family [Gloeobacter morelensis MG652769]
MRVFLDTNIVVSGVITPNGSPGRILHALRERRFELVSCVELAEEIVSVFGRPKIRQRYPHAVEALEQILALLLSKTSMVVCQAGPLPAISDPADAVLLARAAAGGADYFVSGDKSDLLALDMYQNIKIVSAVQFLEILGDNPAL